MGYEVRWIEYRIWVIREGYGLWDMIGKKSDRLYGMGVKAMGYV
jgi:hypothetical protein